MAGIVQYVAKHSPKQSRIVDDLRRRIVCGELSAGAQLPPLTEIEKCYKASTITVQRALQHLRKHGFLFTKPREGNYVSQNPPHLCNFGFLFGRDPASMQWSQFYAAFQQEARNFVSASGAPKRRASFFYQVDGIQAAADYRHLVSDVEERCLAGLVFVFAVNHYAGSPVLAEPSLPRVAITWEPQPGLSVVRLDEMLGKAFDYLVRRGRRRVALISRIEAVTDDDRFPGSLIAAAEEHGITTRPYWIHGVNLNARRLAAHSAELLMHCRAEDRPDALVITDDNLVPYATEGILAAGVRVPDDIEIVAHCNFPYPTPSAVPAVRVGCDVREVFRACIDLIELLRRGEDAPPITSLPVYLDDELKPIMAIQTPIALSADRANKKT